MWIEVETPFKKCQHIYDDMGTRTDKKLEVVVIIRGWEEINMELQRGDNKQFVSLKCQIIFMVR